MVCSLITLCSCHKNTVQKVNKTFETPVWICYQINDSTFLCMPQRESTNATPPYIIQSNSNINKHHNNEVTE